MRRRVRRTRWKERRISRREKVKLNYSKVFCQFNISLLKQILRVRDESRHLRPRVESHFVAAVKEDSALARQLSRIARVEHHPGQLGFDEHFQAPLQLDAKGIAWDGLRLCACLSKLSVNRLLVFILRPYLGSNSPTS